MGSFKPNERKVSASIVPDDLKVFRMSDIIHAFEYMERNFKLSKHWQRECWNKINREANGPGSEIEIFFRFTTENIDPALKRLLRRQDSVIFALCRWLIRDTMAVRHLEQQHFESYKKKNT